jgi:2-C-methyl-D-erythritol 4-phosphate cytidylyltransferase
MKNVCVILLAGGTGSRMNASCPKQYLLLKNKLIVLHSFEVFLSMPEINEIIIVCDPAYQSHFSKQSSEKPIKFALPGKRRQDSVYNGLQSVNPESQLICIHDAARPLVTLPVVLRVLKAAHQHGAAAPGLPLTFTLKESDGMQFVKNSPDRSLMWEIQTPQALRPDILRKGFESAIAQNKTVTDDVSLAELINHPVKLVEGSRKNIKITTQEDLFIAERFAADYP